MVTSGLINDYKNLHGSAPAPGTSATSRWQPPVYHGGRTFGARYPRPSRRGFSSHQGPSWRKKYSLVNRPLGTSSPATDHTAGSPLTTGGSQGPDSQQYVIERQVQLNPDQNMVIKIKPPPQSVFSTASGVQQGSVEEYDDSSRRDQRLQGNEGEPLGGQLHPARSGKAKTGYSVEDSLLVCQKEPGKPRVVKSVGKVSDSFREPRHSVSETEIAIKAHFPSSIPSSHTGLALGTKVGPHFTASCAHQLLGDKIENASHTHQPAPSSTLVPSARPASEIRQANDTSLLVSCRTNKFQKNNYKWVAASAKSPRATRRALSPRTAAESVNKTSFGTAGKTEKPQPRVDLEAGPGKLTMPSKPGPSPSKYKWKASSPSASSSSSFRWQSEAGSKDHTSQLSPVPSRSPPGDRPAVELSSLKPVIGENALSAYKVKSRTKIIRRRGGTSLPDKKNSTSAATTKIHLSQRRRQALRGKSSPILRKTPNKGLMQISRHRLCGLPPSRAHLSSKEASSVHLRTPPSSKVVKTRYRIVKKTPVSPLSAPLCTLSLPSWRSRRVALSRSLALNRLRPAITSGGKVLPSSPRWRSKGYRCIGGVLYKVSANKLSKTSSRPSDSSRVLLRPGRLDPASSCSRSLASRAIQRSLAIIRQARQKKEKKREYCMYYNRFGRCDRGEHCPYIHDPEKVAVCTRFVRGTCKKTDGTCPFSHHVSKEKMPVCSYFLKGICSNSDCPYSHVYVSRKAEVCSDFLKGYCPLGAKCKKKHTLLCPDFARRGVCPRGPHCQLLHRNRKRHGRRAAAPPTPGPSSSSPRNRPSLGHGPRKPSAAHRPAKQMSSAQTSRAGATPSSPPSSLPSPRVLASVSSKATATSSPSSSPSSNSPTPSLDQEEATSRTGSGTGSSSLCKLPSFISLHSSPSPGGQTGARVPRSSRTKDSGKPLHIKPRL
uniref:zinc finger CCCH domain-containing protein 3 isoform X2 n=1 Tax=Jaculus jaculus TaxID=51337 RepID=UPI001E1B130F|nr:zinc finger CCCH domain-containing protein 3 isoform X2 [Jaculus jaculus]